MVDLSQIENQLWEEAQRRASVLCPLVELKDCPRDKARGLGLSERQIYRLIKRLREADGELTALIKRGSDGGRGKQRLDALRENVISRLITEFFLTRQKKSKASLVREIRKVSASSGLKPASGSTIRRRLKKLSPAQLKQRGEQHPEAKPIYGETPVSDTPLDWIQMDHTPVDLIIVDPIDRLPIGRPWITIAIDVFSRCIAGFFLSLDAPSATSVGLCLTMVVIDKKTWLEQRVLTQDGRLPGNRVVLGLTTPPNLIQPPLNAVANNMG
jgi:putative transposase